MISGDENCFEPTGTTSKTKAHIKQALRERLKNEYGSTKVKDFLKMQGFDDTSLDYIDSVNNLMYADLTTASIDANANKFENSVSRVQAEADNAQHKIAGHDFLYRQLKKNVGKEEATRLCAEMYDYTLGINDACHILKVYCWALSAADMAISGRDGELRCAPPNHLHSFVSMLAGTQHSLSNGTLAGAIAVSDWQICAVYCLLKEGIVLEDIVEGGSKRKYVEQMYQQYVYDLQDKSRVGNEAPFSNLSIYGNFKLKGLLDELSFLFIDYDYSMEYIHSYVMEVQNIMMDFMDKGDPFTGLPFTFPVMTICMAKDENDELLDTEFVKSICKRPVNRYNLFVSEGTKVCSCCYDGSQKILMKISGEIVYDTFENVFNGAYGFNGVNGQVFHNGSWVTCKAVKVPYTDKYYKITTANNKTIIVTKDHLNPTLRGDVQSDNISVDDWLMFSSRALYDVVTCDKHLTYSDGFSVGLFLGNGENKDYGNDEVASFIKAFVKGDCLDNRTLNLACLNESVEFRKGILAGWYANNEVDSNTCSSVSRDLIDSMEVLCTSLGYNTTVSVSEQAGEVEKPLYFLKWDTSVNMSRRDSAYKIVNNSIYYKVVDIELVDGSPYAYCFEITDNESDEPYFTLPNGVITHNCRLINDTEMLASASSVNSFGGAGALSMGSHRVVCVNLNRVALMADSMDDFMCRLDNLVKDSVTILRAHKDLLINLEKIGQQPRITDGTIKLERLFSTVGILGMWEMLQTLERKFGKDSERDVSIMQQFNAMCMKYGKMLGLTVNIEQIPGESMAVRFCKSDRLLFGEKAVPYYIYSNQAVPLTEKVDVYDRMDADGRVNRLLTGGGIVHLTIGEKVTPAQAENLIHYAVKAHCEHFALNIVYSICSGEDEHVCEGKHTECPTCGASINDYALRIVGFLRRVSSWSDDRKREFQDRHIISNDKIKEN